MAEKNKTNGPAIQLTKQDMKVLVALAMLAFATIVYVSAHQTGAPYEAPTASGEVLPQTQTNAPAPVEVAAEEPVEVAPRSVDNAAPSGSTCGGACGSPTCGARTGGTCGCGG